MIWKYLPHLTHLPPPTMYLPAVARKMARGGWSLGLTKNESSSVGSQNRSNMYN